MTEPRKPNPGETWAYYKVEFKISHWDYITGAFYDTDGTRWRWHSRDWNRFVFLKHATPPAKRVQSVKPKIGEMWEWKDPEGPMMSSFIISSWKNANEFLDQDGRPWVWSGYEKDFSKVWESTNQETANHKELSEFNCKCPRCGEPAYQGLFKIECSDKNCR